MRTRHDAVDQNCSLMRVLRLMFRFIISGSGLTEIGEQHKFCQAYSRPEVLKGQKDRPYELLWDTCEESKGIHVGTLNHATCY